jgi:uncharacterized protein YbjT (DUF2867 family)
MVATADIGRLAAELLQQSWSGSRVVELEGPLRYSPVQVAGAFTRLLGRPVQAQAIAREGWESSFVAQGMSNPVPRIQMLDGFNEGWIEFEGTPEKGVTSLDAVVQELLQRVD